MFTLAIGQKADEPLMEALRVHWGLPDTLCAWQAREGKLHLLYALPTPPPQGMRTVRYEPQNGKVTFKLPEETSPTTIDLEDLLRTYDDRVVHTTGGQKLLLLGAEDHTQRLLLCHAS